MKTHKCRYFNGLSNEKCKAGVRYADVTPNFNESGAGLRIPCSSKPIMDTEAGRREYEKRGTCSKLEFPAQEEVERYNVEVGRMMANVSKAIDTIKGNHSGENWIGTIECPACGGKLRCGIAGAHNNRTRGSCETKNCLNWIDSH